MKTMNIKFFLLSALFFTLTANADDVIIEKSGAQVTTGDVEAFLQSIPEQDRVLFSSNKQRLIEIIDTLIVNKVIYQDALENGVEQDAGVQAKIAQARQKIVIEEWLQQYSANQPDADYRAIAQENYILNKAEYMSPETVDVKHILIRSNNRTADEARSLAGEVLQSIKSGAMDFDAAAKQYTEDPTFNTNQGLIAGVTRGATAPEFEQAAFSLTEESPLSDVVDTRFGSHVVYLVAKNPARQLAFEEVEKQLTAEAEQAQQSRVVSEYVDGIRKQEVEVNQEVLNTYLDAYRIDRSQATER